MSVLGLYGKRIISMVLAATMATTMVPVTALAAGREESERTNANQSAAQETAQTLMLDPNSDLKNLADGDTLIVGENGKVTVVNSRDLAAANADKPAASAGKNMLSGMEMTVMEDENGITLEPDYSGYNGKYYDEAAAAAATDKMQYAGNIEGTDLATYNVIPDEGAQEFSTLFTEDELAEFRAYLATEVPTGKKLTALLAQSDNYSAEVKNKIILDSGFTTDLNAATVSPYFRVVNADGSARANDAAQVSGLTPESGVSAYSMQDSGSVLLAGAAVGDPSSEIVIVDDNAIIIQIEDKNDIGLNGAAVTVRSKDLNVTDVSRNINGVNGYVVIPNAKGIRSGFLNVEMNGYRIVTKLDVDLNGGSVINIELFATGANEIYPRCVDLGGEDVVRKSKTIYLTPSTTTEYTITLMMAASDEAAKKRLENWNPQLHAENSNRGSTGVFSPTKTSWDGNRTRKFEFTRKWSEKLLGGNMILKDGDKLSFVAGSDVYKPNIAVKDGVVERPWWFTDITIGFMGGSGQITIPEGVPVIGGKALSINFFEFPMFAAIGLDGSVMLGINMQMEATLDKASFEHNMHLPHFDSKVKGIFNKIKNSFDKKLKEIQNAKAELKNAPAGHKSMDKSFGATINAMFCANGAYDWDTGYTNVVLSGAVSIEVSGEVVFTTVIPPPVYAGIRVGMDAGVNGGIGLRFKPGPDLAKTTEIIKTDERTGIMITSGISLAVFAGVGIRGILSLEAEGGIHLGFGISYLQDEGNRPTDKTYPHVTADLESNISLGLTVAWFVKRFTYDFPTQSIYNSWETNKVSDLTLPEPKLKVYKVKFDDMEESDEIVDNDALGNEIVTLQSKNMDGSEGDYLGGNPANGYGYQATKEASSINSPIRYVQMGDGVTYAFRIVVVKGRWYTWPQLAYQKENPDGKSFENNFHLIPYDKTYYYDCEFDVVVKQLPGQPNSDSEVIIAMLSGKPSNKAEQAEKDMICRLLRVNLKTEQVLFQETLAGADGQKKTSPVLLPERDGKDLYTLGYLLGQNKVELWSYGVGTNKAVRMDTTDMPQTEKQYVVLPAHYWGWSGLSDFIQINNDGQSLNGYFAYDGRRGKNNGTIVTDHTRSAMERGEYANLQLVPKISMPGGAQNIDIMLYTVNGKLKFLTWADIKTNSFVTVDGKPFTIPKGCTLMKMVTGTLEGKPVTKLLLVHKERVKDANGKMRMDSILNVYTLQNEGVSKFILRGPQEYRFEGQDMNRVEAMFYDYEVNRGLRMLYTANVNRTFSETDVDGVSVKEACTLYRWNEPIITTADMKSFSLNTNVIKKSDTKVTASAVVENTGTYNFYRVKLEIRDNDGRVISDVEKNVDLYPGESTTLSWDFAPHKDWRTGPMKLTARVLSVARLGEDNAEITVPQEHEGASFVRDYSRTELEISAEDIIIGDKHYAQVNYGNDSLMTSSEDTKINIYEQTNNQMLGATASPDESLDVGALEAGWDDEQTNRYYTNNYNRFIPLDIFWDDPDCSGIVIELVNLNEEGSAVYTTLQNPKAAHRYAVNTAENEPAYGSTIGGGYYLPGAAVTLQAEAKQGYRFTGWRDENGTVVSTDASFTIPAPEGTVKYTAFFEETGDVHLVTLFAGPKRDVWDSGPAPAPGGDALVTEGGEVLAIASGRNYSVAHGATIKAEAWPHGGYEFVGWEDENGQIVSTSDTYIFPVTRAITLHALFKSEVGRYSVYFDATTNGGTTTVESMQTDANGKLSSLPTASKRGASFRGWFTQATGGTRVTQNTVFTQDTTVYAQFGSGSSGGGSESKSTLTFDWNPDTTSDNVKDGKVDAGVLAKEAAEALKAGRKYVLVRNANEISPEAMKAVYDVSSTMLIYADTTVNGAVVLRLYLNPALGKDLKNSILLGGSVKAEAVKALFEKHYDNKVAVLHLNQAVTFGMPVDIAARMDLSGLDTKTLRFYSYNRETNKYNTIKTSYYIDANGYLRFTTTLAGDIIITDKPLTAAK